MPRFAAVSALVLVSLMGGCKTADSAVDGVKSAGSAVADGVGSVTTSLVNVDLSNVLNDLALDLKIDKSNIPINAQIPISIAANVCGVSINILSIGGGGKSDGCTANSISPELKQYIQQQIAANGSVGGGTQTTTPGTTTQPATTTTQPTTPQTDPSTPQ